MPATSGDLPASSKDKKYVRASTRVVVAVIAGLIGGFVVSLFADWQYSILGGWMIGALTFLGWVWGALSSMDAPSTASHATREDPGHALADALVVLSSIASLVAVGLLLTGNDSGSGERDLRALLAVGSVALAWAVVHSMFTTRYAKLFYEGALGGIDFNEEDPPQYSDFAYLAFTVGMTFQVSDTELRTKEIRSTVLRQALLSYLFGAVIIATMINLVAGLAR